MNEMERLGKATCFRTGRLDSNCFDINWPGCCAQTLAIHRVCKPCKPTKNLKVHTIFGSLPRAQEGGECSNASLEQLQVDPSFCLVVASFWTSCSQNNQPHDMVTFDVEKPSISPKLPGSLAPEPCQVEINRSCQTPKRIRSGIWLENTCYSKTSQSIPKSRKTGLISKCGSTGSNPYHLVLNQTSRLSTRLAPNARAPPGAQCGENLSVPLLPEAGNKLGQHRTGWGQIS